jgi:hypothetical protein
MFPNCPAIVDVVAAARHGGVYFVQVLQSGAQQTLQPTEADLYRQTVETASGCRDNLTQKEGNSNLVGFSN